MATTWLFAVWQACAEFLADQLEQAQLALSGPRAADSPEIAADQNTEAPAAKALVAFLVALALPRSATWAEKITAV